MSTTTKLLTAIAIAPACTLLAGCKPLDCGPGTTEVNGECVPAEGQIPENIYCGPGTSYDGTTQSCLPDTKPTICDPDTTVEVVDINGVTICEGTGGGGCTGGCPQPDSGKITVCGRLTDAETGEFISVEGATGTNCADIPVEDREGPCLMKVQFYDALAFAQAPSATAPLDNDAIVVNDCGWFKGDNIKTPALGFLAVGADDTDDVAAEDDQWVLTGVVFPVNPGDRRPDQVTYVVSNTTDDKWTESAGYPFGASTFSQKGVFFPIYKLAGEPVEGVQITRESAGVVEADDYYFSDTDPDIRSTVDVAQNATGPNGAGLMVNSPLIYHAAIGGLPAGCTWKSDLAKSIPNVVFANERPAIDSEGEDCVP